MNILNTQNFQTPKGTFNKRNKLHTNELLKRIINNPFETVIESAKIFNVMPNEIVASYELIRKSKVLTNILKKAFTNHYNLFRQITTKEGKFWEDCFKGTKRLPQEIEWHTGLKCPLHCYFCCSLNSYSSQQYFSQAYSQFRKMNYPAIRNKCKAFLESCANNGCHTLQISGGKEPTGTPLILYIARIAKSLGMNVRLNTSGVLLNAIHNNISGDTVIKEYTKHFDQIAISTEAASAKAYNLIKRVPVHSNMFDKLCNNINNLVKYRTILKSKLILEIVILVLPENINDLKHISEFYLSKGIDIVRFRRLKSETFNLNYPFKNKRNYLENKFKELGFDDRIIINREDFSSKYEEIVKSKSYCWSKLRKVVINPIGIATSCAFRSLPGNELSDRSSFIIGNIFQLKDMKQLWKNRETLYNKIKTESCDYCFYADRILNMYLQKLKTDFDNNVRLNSQPFFGEQY